MVTVCKKPLKIRGVSKPDKIGIAASNLKDVLQKGCEKLKLPVKGTKVYLEADATLVAEEHYFQTLDKNTCVVLVGNGQAWTGGLDKIKSDIGEMLQKTGEMNRESLVRKLLDEDPSDIHQLLGEFVSKQSGNIDAEGRGEDADWFQDIEPRFTTKSDVMFAKAQERVRGYFSKTKEMLSNGTLTYLRTAKNRHTQVIQSLKDSLRMNNFHGVYFKRTSVHKDRLCDAKGWFRCQGAYDTQTCDHSHTINPYSTKETMVLFSTWNLDHVTHNRAGERTFTVFAAKEWNNIPTYINIEKSRSVIPGLNEAIRDCPAGKEVNAPYFYDHLFTRTNLKLVHICCHKKGKHTGKVDKKRFYRNSTGSGS